ncbi:MAG: hypothetical protein ABWK53_06420 [Anaerolineales bacterium]
MMSTPRYVPDPGRLSVLTASVLLTYALTHVLSTPLYPIHFSLAGLSLDFEINLNAAFAILAAALSAAGVDWLLRAHPSIQPGETVEHWLAPMLTALVVGIALATLPGGGIWWVAFGIGGLLLAAVFVAEYVVVDPADTRYPLASAALTVLAFALHLILAVALRAGGARLLFLVLAVLLASGLVALRTLHLRLNERWEFAWALVIALISAQLAAGLYFWPLTPIRFGLILLGPVYGLTGVAAMLAEGEPLRRALLEPAVMLGLFWGLAIWLG